MRIKKSMVVWVLLMVIFFSATGFAQTYEEIYGNLNSLNYQINHTILSEYANVHPKILLTNEKLQEMVSDTPNNIYLGKSQYLVLRSARWGLENDPPAEIDTSSYDSFFSSFYDFAPSLALSYLLTKEQKYLDGALKWMLAAASYPAWENRPDLATGIGLTSLALSYDWLYDYISPTDGTLIKNKLIEQGNLVYAYLTGPRYSRYWLQNHMWIPTVGMACAALALYGEASQTEPWLHLAMNYLSITASFLPEDGYAHEGMDYFFYGMECIFIFADLSVDLFGVDMFETNFFQNVSDYLLYNFYPKSSWGTKNYYSNMGDSGGIGLKNHMLRLLAKRTGNEQIQWLANELDDAAVASGHPYLKMLWYDNHIPATAPTDLPLLKHFNDLDFAVSKTGWDGNESMLIFHSGLPMGNKEQAAIKNMEKPYDFGGAHVHPDNNHFILYGNGELLIRDDLYTVPKFTSQHNTLTIDGVGQLGDSDRWFDTLEFHNGNGSAKIKKAQSIHNVDHIIGDATKSYRAESELTKFERHLIYIKPDILIVVDDIRLDHPKSLRLRLWPQSQNITQTSDGFETLSEKNRLHIKDLSQNSDSVFSETETIWAREVTQDLESISFVKNASEWMNVSALSWSGIEETPPALRYSKSGDLLVFETDLQEITLNPLNGELTVTPIYEINYAITGQGTVTQMPEQIGAGKNLQTQIIPEDGWYIESVKLNGIVLAENQRTPFSVDATILKDSTLAVVFKESAEPPTIATIPKVFTSPGYGGIIFAKVTIPSNAWKEIEYGVAFSKTENPVNSKKDVLFLKATAPKNAIGQFGIQITGQGIKPSVTYFTCPYVKYKDHGEWITIFAEPIAFTPESTFLNNFLKNGGFSIIPITSYKVETID